MGNFAKPSGSELRISRREFLKMAGLATAGLAAGLALGAGGGAAGAEAEAARAKHYVMLIDLRRCVGCDACTLACKQENRTPPGVTYNVVLKEEVGTYPYVRMVFHPRPCMHCEDPPCVRVCPVGATYKRREDGIVVVDYERCLGCRYCMAACPYGARHFDFGDYYYEPPSEFERLPSPEYGRAWLRQPNKSPVGNVRKCHFCLHRLEKGLEPACVQTCVSKARIFGDLNDPAGEVRRLLGTRPSYRLKEELGTRPSVYYLT